MNRSVCLFTFVALPCLGVMSPANVKAGCCDGRSASPTSAGAAGPMMGPLNEPLQATLVNPTSTPQSASLGESSVSAAPGTGAASFSNDNGQMTPQPGEQANFASDGGTGLKSPKCPPEGIVSSSSFPDAPSTTSPQSVGTPPTTNNLDAPGPGQQGTDPVNDTHLGSGGVSPAALQMTPAGNQSDAEIHFSAGLGLSASDPRVSAGFLMPAANLSTQPHLLGSYRIRSANGATWVSTSSTTAAINAPRDTTILTQVTPLVLQIDFHQAALGNPLPAPLPTAWKSITITKLASTPPAGCHLGWGFAVTYPGGGGVANTTTTWISQPGSATAKTTVSSNGQEESWTSSVATPATPVRTAGYEQRINSVLVKKTVDVWQRAATGTREILISSTVGLDLAGGGLTTSYTYWNTPGQPSDGLLQREIRPDGSWVLHALAVDPIAQTSTDLTVTPFGSTAPPAVAGLNGYADVVNLAGSLTAPCVATFTKNSSIAQGSFLPAGSVIDTEKRIAGTVVEKMTFNPANGCYEALNRKSPADGVAADSSTALEIVAFTPGNWTNNGSGNTIRVSATGKSGQAPDFSDFMSKRTTTHHVDSATADPALQTTTTTTVSQADSASGEIMTDIAVKYRMDGRPVRLERQLNGVAYEVTQWAYDAYKRKTSRTVNGVLRESWAYPSPGAGAVTAVTYAAADGTRTTSEYDAQGRMLKETLHGSAAATVFSTSLALQADVVTTWTYAGRAAGLPGYVATQTATASGVSRISTAEYDGAGRIVVSVEPTGATRYYTYGWNAVGSVGEGGQLNSVFAGAATPTPTGALSVSSYHRDGSMLSLSGAGVVPADYLYSVPGSYRQATTRRTTGQEVQTTTVDGFGRTIEVRTPVSVNALGVTVFTNSRSGWDTDGRLAWRSQPSPNGGMAYKVWAYDPAAGEVKSGLSLETTLSLLTSTSLRKTITINEIDTTFPALAVDGTSVSMGWRSTTQIMPDATVANAWETAAASLRRMALSERPLTSAWLGHAAGSSPLEYRNDGGTIYAEALTRTWTGTELNTQRIVQRNTALYRKVIARNGLGRVFSSPEAVNITLLFNSFRDVLAEMSWDTIPHWPKLETEPLTGLTSARLLPNSSLYTAKYTYFTGAADHRAGRMATSQTWAGQTNLVPGQAKGTTYYHYNAMGQTLASYGDGTSPAAYTYDSAGRMTLLRTWRTTPTLSPATIDTDLANAAATAQTTTWNYSAHPTLALVRSKQYPGQSTALTYGYAANGSLTTRDWERTDAPGGNRLRTTWVYNSFAQPVETHYGSTAVTAFASSHPLYTPSVLSSYDRTGRVRYRTDGTGTTLLTYRFDGSPVLETAVSGPGSTVALATGRQLRRSYNSLGEQTGLESAFGQTLGAVNYAGNAFVSPYVEYYYSNSRLGQISSGGMWGGLTRTASQEVFSVNPMPIAGSIANNTAYGSYNSVTRDAFGRPSSHYAAYTYNYYGSSWQPVELSNTPFTWDADRLLSRGETDQIWNYSYDARSQVASAHKKFNSGGAVVAGSQNEYSYDGIGNRLLWKEGGSSTLGAGLRQTTYLPNELNQYSRIDRPQTFDVAGRRSNSTATIVVNGTTLSGSDFQPTTNSLYFRKEVANTPTPPAVTTPPTATADLYEPVNVTQNGTALTPNLGGAQYLGAPAVVPAYDADGNVLSDGRWTYTWDGENRLIKMEALEWIQPATGYLPGNTLQGTRLEFTYDGLSRRTSKKTTRITSNNIASSAMEGYAYDGWNVVMISQMNPTTGAATLRKWSCIWKPDTGSSLYARSSWQKAGGVGGLAWLQAGSSQSIGMGTYNTQGGPGYAPSGTADVHIPFTDHLGNVRHYFRITLNSANASSASMSGTPSASLEYDAFGREVRVGGTTVPTTNTPPGLTAGTSYADALPFHFSTKFTDPESGLNYYGYRYYDARDGRWPSRDPIGERGGMNLYGMVGNRPVNSYDILGLDEPGPGDQFNPFGVRGGQGDKNYTDYFNKRFPNSIAGALALLKQRIKDLICAENKAPNYKMPKHVALPSEQSVDIAPDGKRFGDPAQGYYEEYFKIRYFQVKAEVKDVTWASLCFYGVTAKAYVEETTGANPPTDFKGPADIFWFTGMFSSRKVRMAEWDISFTDTCPNCCDHYAPTPGTK